MSHHYPRLELLKQQASEMGLSRDQVREFGSLTRRATWETAIAFYNATTPAVEWKELKAVDNVIHSEAHDTRVSSILNLPQITLLILLTVVFFALVAPVLRVPLPIKITIQIGTKL